MKKPETGTPSPMKVSENFMPWGPGMVTYLDESVNIPKSTAAMMVAHKKALEQAIFFGHHPAHAVSVAASNYTQIVSYAPKMTREQAIALNNGAA